MPILETIFSASLHVLFDRLASPELFKFTKSNGIDARLKEWNSMLPAIRQSLEVAEKMESSGTEALKLWLDSLGDFTYEAEDVLDEIATDASTSNHPNLKNQLFRFADLTFRSFNPTAVACSDLSVESKIDSLTRKLRDLMDPTNSLRALALQNMTASLSSEKQVYLPCPTSEFDRSSICGREDDKQAILQLLFSGTSIFTQTVIPIVGMGGLGKTTLAQLMYHDDQVKSFFNLRVWVHVSQEYNIRRLTQNILESIIKNRCEDRNLVWLQQKLGQVLSRKKFLIVLDDVWSEFYYDWQQFYNPFRNGVPGSKFIVTTRSKGVASMMGDFESYNLQLLSDDHCLCIFAHHALGATDFNAHPHLHSIGREIVRKCSGCPLVAMALGGHLRSERDPTKWKALLDEEVWDLLKKVSSSTIPGLMLSYHLLPRHLKRCFAYCSLFPKRYLFEKDVLVQLWTAEGFLPVGDEKEMEDVGSSYFNGLLSRSFFQPSSRDKTLFEMHDLISDLCQVAADDVFLHLENKLKSNDKFSFPQKVRHTSFFRDTTCVFDKIQSFDRRSCFRTLLALTSSETQRRKVSLSVDVLHKLLSEVRRLRVLSLNYYVINALPGPICYLRLLRYLDLSGTPIECLPDSVTSLINLQSLLLNNCYILVELPQDIENLVNLRELEISDTPKLQEMPVGIGKLGSLKKLSKYIVGGDKGLRIKKLGKLSQLQGVLFISGLHNVLDDEDARKANLKDKNGMVDLSMEWSCTFDGSRNDMIEMKVLNSLQPHANLRKLVVKYYSGHVFAPWIGHLSFANMVSIELYDCRKVRSLPSLGRLPSLRDLSIRGLYGVRTVGSEFYGVGDGYPFPHLETLRFEDMPEWEQWLSCFGARMGEVERDFPRIRVLQMMSCPMLIGNLPEGLMNSSNNDLSPLERLEISGCPSLACFPSGEMSTPALKQLIIHGCSQLDCITQRMPHFSSLLVRIDFSGYTNLKSLPVSLHSLVHLVKLSITNCPSLESFPDFSQSDVSFSSLKELSIYNCDNLKSLPNHMQNITSLQSLHISNCQGLVSFPEGGLPPNLTCLSIWNCANIHQPVSEWGLRKLTSLLRLTLHAVCTSMVSFPDYDTLPENITYLFLSEIKNLESLSDEILVLSSLEDLLIENCPKFQFMDDLPSTLNRFSICGCNLMQQHCQRYCGGYWQLIERIRWVERD